MATLQVQQLYVAYFGRAADVAGLQYWDGVLTADPNSLQEMSQSFAASPEYTSVYGPGTSSEKVAAVYQNLFGRVAEPAGVAYWADLLDRGLITLDNLVTQVAGGALGGDKFVFDAKVSVSDAITLQMDQPIEIAAYNGAQANQIVRNYVATVRDLLSAAQAIDPGAIDNLINQVVAAAQPVTTAAPDDGVGLVGVPDPAPLDGASV